MSVLNDFVVQVRRAKAQGEGLTLTPEQTAQLADELESLQGSLTDEDIANMPYEKLFNMGESRSMAEIANSPYLGAWADWDLGDSAEYVSKMRHHPRW